MSGPPLGLDLGWFFGSIGVVTGYIMISDKEFTNQFICCASKTLQMNTHIVDLARRGYSVSIFPHIVGLAMIA